MKLNIGCGGDIRKGWMNLDYIQAEGVDFVHDLNEPLPFLDNSIDEILASHVLEHIWTWEETVKDCHRVLKPGGIITIRVPYGLDPNAYHYRTFEEWTLDNFLDNVDTNHDCLQREPIFHQISRKVNRRLPLQWHLTNYFKVQLPRYGRLGKKAEVVWILKAVKNDTNDGIR